MSTLPTGTVTFFFSDLEGSTQLWETSPDAMRADLARHDALLHGIISGNGGTVFKTMGDAFCAVFPTAQEAVKAALTAQQALHAEAWTVGRPGLRARLALHSGEAQERGGDYFGPTLNRAARLMGIAHGGQTVLSQATEQLVRDALPDGVGLRDLGSHRLKDLLRPEQVFQLGHPDLPRDFPPLRSLNEFPHNLPQRLDSFVGRAAELAQVKRLLGASRLVTLTGVGGAGKTRLAQQAAAESLDQFPQGVWFVSLEALSEPALIPQAVAAAIGVREQAGQSLTVTLCETLRAQKLLLLLDNCEHLIGASAQFAQTVLQACPAVQILATSRELLGIGGEACLPVPTLPTAPSSSEASDVPPDAVRLFVERAALSQPSFALTPQNAAAVVRICRQLDGIPLAIELAAPHVKMLSAEQIGRRLDQRLRLLTGGSRTALPRQQTMRAAIQWSHDLLTESERLLFRRLSVFAGGWTLEAAEAVCAGDDLDEYEVFDLLSLLVAKSLVQSDELEGGEHRYRLLETLHEYSREQASPDAARIGACHTDYFLALAERAETELRGPQQGEWLDRLEAEHDNLRGALARSDGGTRLRLAAHLHRFWWMRGYLTEGRKWLQEALDGADDAADRQMLAKALTGAGILAWAQNDHGVARTLYGRARVLYDELGDEEGVARMLTNLGIVADAEEDPAARGYYEDSLAILRRLGDRVKVAYVLVNLAAHHIEQKNPQDALPLLDECLQIRRALGDRSGIATSLLCLGRALSQQGDWSSARDHFRQSLAIQWRLGEKRGVMDTLHQLADAEMALGRAAEAVRLLAASQTLGETLHIPLSGATRQDHDRLEASLRSSLGDEQYAALGQQGRSSPLDRVISDALR